MTASWLIKSANNTQINNFERANLWQRMLRLQTFDISMGVLLTIGVVLIALPLGNLLIEALRGEKTGWSHILHYILPAAGRETLILCLGVGFVTVSIGVLSAFLTHFYTFRGKRWLEVCLILPIALPVYISTFAYVELLDSLGPVQTMIRAFLGIKNASDFMLPDIRSLSGAIWIMGFTLYPYVYICTRISFRMQSRDYLESAMTLGFSGPKLFFRVAIPLARPAIIVGVLLAIMEVLNDVGAVSQLGVNSLTLAIFDLWLNQLQLGSAAQLSLSMLMLIALIVWLERRQRGFSRFIAEAAIYRQTEPATPSPLWSFLIPWICALPMIVGFAIPVTCLLGYSILYFDATNLPQLTAAGINSLSIAAVTVILTLIIATILTFGLRYYRNARIVRIMVLIACTGYAIPGSILAIGTLNVVGSIDLSLATLRSDFLGMDAVATFAGTSIMVVYACSIRYMALAVGPIEAAYKAIPKSIDSAALTLGASLGTLFTKIHAPLLRPAFLITMLIVFVDTCKELSATLLLRPFDVETLATLIYAASEREEFAAGAVPSLILAILGAIPIVVLSRKAFR